MSVTLGVDEVTLVQGFDLSTFTYAAWPEKARQSIADFAKAMCLTEVFGVMRPTSQALPKGYTEGFEYGRHSFYLRSAYHPDYPKMGVCHRLSAQAFEAWLDTSGLSLHHFFATALAVDGMHCTRLDVKADYIDEDLNVHALYSALRDGSVCGYRWQRSSKSHTARAICIPTDTVTGFLSDGEVRTIYIGSLKANHRVRIYDKRLEQIQRHGVHYGRAVACGSWVRCELEIRHGQAVQLGEKLASTPDGETARLLADVICQYYFFAAPDDKGKPATPHPITALLDASHNLVLSQPRQQPSELLRSIKYVVEGSGFLSLAHKVQAVWPESGLLDLLRLMLREAQGTPRSAATESWLAREGEAYKQAYAKLDDLLRQVEGYRRQKGI